MRRNLKALGLALLTALALGAVGAQGASAVVEHSFTSDSATGSTVLTGTTEPGTKEVFKLTGASISCEDVRYRGTIVGNQVDHFNLYPDYFHFSTNCSSGALGAATVESIGCTFTYDSDTFENTSHFTGGDTHANLSLGCEGVIYIRAGGCIITLETLHSGGVYVNQNLPGVRYVQLPFHSFGKSALTVSTTVRTLRATTSGANCVLVGLGNPGTHSNGTFESKVIVTGYEDLGGTGHGPYVEGWEVNLGLSTP